MKSVYIDIRELWYDTLSLSLYIIHMMVFMWKSSNYIGNFHCETVSNHVWYFDSFFLDSQDCWSLIITVYRHGDCESYKYVRILFTVYYYCEWSLLGTPTIHYHQSEHCDWFILVVSWFTVIMYRCIHLLFWLVGGWILLWQYYDTTTYYYVFPYLLLT